MSVTLDDKQQRALSFFVRGLNVAVLGSAGSGKSVLLRAIIKHAVDRWGANAVAVVAPAGSAAVAVGGQTIHSLFGWDVRPLNQQRWLVHTQARPGLCSRLRSIRVLVVDEAPTMPSSVFSRMAFVMRHVAPVHLQGLPLGGRQVVCMFLFYALQGCVQIDS